MPLVSPIIFNKVQKLIRQNDKRRKRDVVSVEALPVAQPTEAAAITS